MEESGGMVGVRRKNEDKLSARRGNGGNGAGFNGVATRQNQRQRLLGRKDLDAGGGSWARLGGERGAALFVLRLVSARYIL